ncbi:MAG: Ig-like domain-containing protein [Actinomycetota bacterium]
MRRIAMASVLSLSIVLFGSPALAQHFDGNANNGTFNPTETETVTQTLINRPTGYTLDITQVDHEDSPAVIQLRQPEWQFDFADLKQAQDSTGAPTTSCSAAVDGSGSTAHFARAEKVGTIRLQAAADGVTRPGAPALWTGDIAFIWYDAVNHVGNMCLLAITTDTRITSLNQPSVTAIQTGFKINLITDSTGTFQEVYSNLTGLIQDSTLQQVNASLIELGATIFAHSAGNWQPGGIDFSKSPAVSGTKNVYGIFTTCPNLTPPPSPWGGCNSQFGPTTGSYPPLPAGWPGSLTHKIPFTFTIPAPVITGPPADSLTNKNPVPITGTSDPNASVQIYENGAPISGATGTADASGNWTANAQLPDGSHTVTARVFDAGGTSPDSNTTSFKIDTVPPVPPTINEPAAGSTNNGTSVTFAGTTEPSADVDVAEAGVIIASAHSNQGGGWSVTTTLTKGPHTIQARATDAAGNVGSYGSTISFNVTTATPVIQSPSSQDFTTNNPNIVFAGTAEPGSTVTVYEGSNALGSSVATPSGSWSFTATLPEGDHTVSAVALNGGFTSAASTPFTFNIDLTPPDPAVITSPTNGVEEISGSFNVVGTSEPRALITVDEGSHQLGQATSDLNGNWSIPVVLQNGAHTIVAQIKDRSGNVGPASAPVSFTIKDPLEIVTPRDGSITQGKIVVSGNAATQSSEVQIFDGLVQIGEAPISNGQWSIPMTFSSGTHSLTVRAVTQGSVGAPSKAVTFRVDADAPRVLIYKPFGYTSLGGVVFDSGLKGSAHDDFATDTGVQSVTITYTNILTGSSVTVAPDNCYLCPGPYVQWTQRPHLFPGFYTVTATATDGVGNVGTDVATLLIAF